MIVCDTGPLVALAHVKDEHNVAANDLFRALHMTAEQIMLPATVLAEVCCWLNEHGGPEVEANLLRRSAGQLPLAHVVTAPVETTGAFVVSAELSV